jgi:4-hydroxyacetophenone monooxygenase
MTLEPEQSLITCGGHELAVVRGGSGRPLLVLHDELGWSGWLTWCEKLAETHQLIVPLQPGFGVSPRIRWIRSYRDLALFYARVVRELGFGQIDVIGFSAGGYIAAELAVSSPELVRRLTLVAPMGVRPTDGIIADFLAMAVGQHVSETVTIKDAPDVARMYGGEMTPDRFELFEDARAETARLGWEPFMFNPSLPHHLGGLSDLPVQLVWGDRDQIVPEGCISAYAAALPNARVDVLRGAGHRPEVELPDEFISAVSDFRAAGQAENTRRQVVDDPSLEISASELDEKLAKASVPVLVVCLAQITGDPRWLGERYRPARIRGLADDPTGGLPEDVQNEVRRAMRDAVLEWRAADRPSLPVPTPEQMPSLMEQALGEEVSPRYSKMMLAHLGFARRESDPEERPWAEGKSVIIIGAGVGGLLAARNMVQRGFDVTVLEQQPGLGGVWRTNHYPGARVDTPSAIYTYADFRRNWADNYGTQPQILEYLNEFVDTFDLRRLIRFESPVTSARYREDQKDWEVTFGAAGEHTQRADFVISAVGTFARPAIPEIPGRENFKGQIFHTTQWPDEDVVTGKRVAVVGSGSTAIQVVSTIAGQARHLYAVQRSPHWIAPAPNYLDPVEPEIRWLVDNIPFYAEWASFRVGWPHADKIYPSMIIDKAWEHPDRSINERNDRHRQFLVRYAEEQLKGFEELLPHVLPTYPPYGKRMVVDSGWFAALRQPNVDLVPSAMASLTENELVTSSGQRLEVDTIVLATGFEVAEYLLPMKIIGRDGQELHDFWAKDGARAHKGITVPGFPNFFILYGPNVNGAAGSYTGIAEAQLAHIDALLEELRRSGSAVLEPRMESFTKYNVDMDDRLTTMIWSHPNVDSYIKTPSGRIIANRPWSAVEFFELMTEVDRSEFTFS